MKVDIKRVNDCVLLTLDSETEEEQKLLHCFSVYGGAFTEGGLAVNTGMTQACAVEFERVNFASNKLPFILEKLPDDPRVFKEENEA